MELWIRTQSKQSLVKVDNVSITKKTETRYNVDSGEWILGRYNSFERALEVLDEIENFITTRFIVENSTYETADIKVKSDILCNMSKIYDMPKE